MTPRTVNPGSDGMRAKKAGLPVDACPYEPGPHRTAWVVGWYIAEGREGDKQSAVLVDKADRDRADGTFSK